MHDQKVNTKATEITPAPSKIVVLKTPYGELRLDAVGAHDHATMKAHQLKACLTLISGQGQENFVLLNGDLQNSFLWMLQQGANELDQLLEQVGFADAEVTK